MEFDRANDTLLAFLAQPVHAIAREGEGFASEVIAMLKRWRSDQGGEVVRERGGGVVVLSPGPRSTWSVVVISDAATGQSERRAKVCAIGFGTSFSDVRRFEALSTVRHFCPVMEVTLGDLTPPIFGILAGDDCLWDTGVGHARWPYGISGRNALSEVFRAAVHRRPPDMKSEAWDDLFDDARLSPLIMGEEMGDQFVLLTRHYLQELLEPTGARALGRKYASRALDASSLIDLPERPADPLDALPGIARA